MDEVRKCGRVELWPIFPSGISVMLTSGYVLLIRSLVINFQLMFDF
jgi:hypothetical protein